MANSSTEENYLKAIYKLSEQNQDDITTKSIADKLVTSPASVTDMLKKLSEKNLINYQKYQGVSLTENGEKIAINIIRKHRLWEVFLVNKLGFKWDKVHSIAEELEHINSEELIERLDNFLDNPLFDPHGDPIPNQYGKFSNISSFPLSDVHSERLVTMTGVIDHSSPFLQYLDKTGISLGCVISIKDTTEFDRSLTVVINNDKQVFISNEVAKNILVCEITN